MINSNYDGLSQNYLFTEVGRRAAAYAAAHPDERVIKLSIGDVTQPLCPAAVNAMKRAAAELGTADGFRGYGPEQGYDFLRQAVAGYYARRGVCLDADEIFISDGAKSDLGNILDIFDTSCTVTVQDPVYPVYVDTNIMSGRRIFYAEAKRENDFLPMPDEDCAADIIYLCSPNNPCGAAYNREQLAEWVSFALRRGSVILFDAAYESFVESADIPRSIYEFEGAKECAIEFCSLSKTAGFTGTRCGYTVVPRALVRDGHRLRELWLRRQTTKFNGVPYIVQRGAEAIFTDEGIASASAQIAYYKKNAAVIAGTLDKLGVYYTGGVNSPYIWMKCPDGCGSWEYFDLLLNKLQVVATPGAGFGRCGEGYLRLTAFGRAEDTVTAMARLESAGRGILV